MRLVSLLLFFVVPVWGASLGIEPMLLSDGSVNVINGDYCGCATDLTVRCAQPISLTRYHISSETTDGVSGIWHLNQNEIHVYWEEGWLCADLIEPDGTTIPFRAIGPEKSPYIWSILVERATALKPQTSILPTVSFDGEDNRATDRLTNEETGRGLILHRGNGESRTYRFCYAQQGKLTFRLEEVRLANGNKVFYSYDVRNRLIEVRSTDAKESVTYGSIKLAYTDSCRLCQMIANNNQQSADTEASGTTKPVNLIYSDSCRLCHAMASDGQQVAYLYHPSSTSYSTRKEEHTYDADLLECIIQPGGLRRQYAHDFATNSGYPPFVIIGSIEGDIFQRWEYWRKGRNEWDTFNVKIGDRDSSIGKVRCQYATLNLNNDPSPVYTYFYYQHHGGGHTDVIDARRNCSTYYYNDHHQIQSVWQGGVYEHNWWGDDQLIRQAYFADPESRGSASAHQYSYSKGRLIEDRFLGVHTGTRPNVLIRDGMEVVDDNVETYITRYQYLSEDSNLLAEETDGYTTTCYTYKEGTNLLTSRLFYEGTGEAKILRNREFIEYEGAFPSRITQDNRSSFWRWATESHTTDTVRYANGLPKTITESDLQGQSHRTDFYYNAQNLVIREDHFDAADRFLYSLITDRDEFGQVTCKTDPLGQETHYTYDEHNRVVSCASPLKTCHYVYDRASRCISITTRNDSGEELSETFTFNELGQKTSSTDTLGWTTHYVYDLGGNCIETTQIIKGQAITTSRKYDYLGRLVSETTPDGETTSYTYTARGQPLSITHPDGGGEWYRYDLQGNVVQHTLATGAYTLYERDYLGRETSCVTYSPDGALLSQTFTEYEGSHPISHTDSEGNTTHYRYNGRGQLVCETLGDSKTEYQYDDRGNQSARFEWYGSWPSSFIATYWEYDLLDRVISEKCYDGYWTLLAHTQTEYDAEGNILNTIRHEGDKTLNHSFSYDIEGRIIGETNEEEYTTTTTYLAYPHCEIQQVCDPMGTTHKITYDTLGNPTIEERYDADGTLAAKTENHYSPGGRKLEQICYLVDQGSPRHTTKTRWNYDQKGRLAALTEAADSPDEAITRYHYNRLGQLCQINRPSGARILYQYDCLGRLISHSGPDFCNTYTYNGKGEILTANGTARTYNAKGEILREHLENGLTLTYTYDRLGRCTQKILPDGSSTDYQWDARLKSVTRTRSNGEQHTHAYLSYTKGGQLLHAKDIWGDDIHYTYDHAGRCTEVLSSAYYECLTRFDPLGNLLTKLVRDMEEWEAAYTYNALGYLDSESAPTERRFVYDSVGNRSQLGEKWVYNERNQLLSDGIHTFAYDQDSRLITIESAEETLRLFYDGLDRLIAFETPSQRVEFTYDPFNRRLSKTVHHLEQEKWVASPTIFFIWEGQYEVGAADDMGRITEFRTLGLSNGAEIGGAVAIELEGEIYAPAHDIHGSVTALVNSQHLVTESYRYTAFGECEVYNRWGKLQETSRNPWRFWSKREDPESGLIYFGLRYYLSRIGRWISPDPVGYNDGPNLYAFAGNNPLAYLDLKGAKKSKRFWTRVGVGAAIVLAAIGIGAAMAANDNAQSYPSYRYNPIPTYDSNAGSFTGETSGTDPPTGTIIICRDQYLAAVGESNGNWSRYCLGGSSDMKIRPDQLSFAFGTVGKHSPYENYGALRANPNPYQIPGCSHHPSGFAVTDVLEGIIGTMGCRTPRVRQLTDLLNNVFTNSPNGRVLILTEGYEDVHVHNTLRGFGKERTHQIQVIDVAPKTYINPKYAQSVTHLSSTHDPVRFIPTPRRFAAHHTIQLVQRHPNAPFFDFKYNSLSLQDETHQAVWRFANTHHIRGWEKHVDDFFTRR